MRVLLACIAVCAGTVIAQDNDAPNANPLVARQQEFANAFFESMGGRVIQELTESGLSLPDSEEIARRYAADIAECGTTTITEEAARHSISIEELLLRFLAAMRAGEWNRPDVIARASEVIDLTATSTVLIPCIANATQRAGLSYQAESEATRNEVFPDRQ